MAGNAKRKLVVSEFVTLDGVMQAPGLADEDTEGGFKHGGWQQPYFDEVFMRAVEETMTAADALLLGRKTYDIFARYWPTTKDPIAPIMNNFKKHVVSRTRDRLDWQNSVLIKGDVAPEIAKLKQQDGKDLLVFGSGTLVQTLLRNELVDELLLVIHPLIIGSGKRLFREEYRRRPFTLVDSKPTTKGVLVARYRAAPSAGA
jgi:dihydrofolate reductase